MRIELLCYKVGLCSFRFALKLLSRSMAFGGFEDESNAGSEVRGATPGPVLPLPIGAVDSTNFFALGETLGINLKVRTAFAAALEVDVGDEDTLAVDVGSIEESEATSLIAGLATEAGPLNALGRGAAWRWFRSARLLVHQLGLGPVPPPPWQGRQHRPHQKRSNRFYRRRPQQSQRGKPAKFWIRLRIASSQYCRWETSPR